MNIPTLPYQTPLLYVFATALCAITLAKILKLLATLLVANHPSRASSSLNPTTRVWELPHIPYVGSPNFFKDPFAFISSCQERFGGSWFKFTMCGHNIVVASGDAAFKTVFHHKSMSFLHGYTLLTPAAAAIFPKGGQEKNDSYGAWARQFLRTDVIQSLVGPLLRGESSGLESWGDQGVMESRQLQDFIVHVCLWFVIGQEASADPKTVRSIIECFHRLEGMLTPKSALFPWILTPLRIRQILSAFSMYQIYKRIINKRHTDKHPSADILQRILDENLGASAAAKKAIMMTFAAGTNTSKAVMWLYIYLLRNEVWLKKVEAEVAAFLQQKIPHCKRTPSSMTDALCDLSVEEWESDSLSTLELCVQETLRLILIGGIPRQNIGPDIEVDGHIIQSNDFVMFMTTDIHLNPDLYEDPTRFWPDRIVPGSNVTCASLAWGAGRHACVGQRLAKCLIKVVTVLLLASFDFKLVDEHGNEFASDPPIQREVFNIGRPADKVFFKYARKCD